MTVSVDNDIPGSGYSEVKPQNWIGHSVDACFGTYRYLSHKVGDGTRKGKAIWTPTITVTGWYDVTVSYRRSTNRTDDADYIVEDDSGKTQRFTINQRGPTACTKKTLATIYCKAGGSCRVTLDGDDGKSDAADITTFVLTQCSGAPPPLGPCQPIAQNPAYELCVETPTSCAGVYTNGAGCQAFCAAVGGTCTAAFGGEPGCNKESSKPLSCTKNSGNSSDWCECALPAPPDAGAPTPDQGATPAPDQGTTPTPDQGAPVVDQGTPINDQGPTADAQPARDAGLATDAAEDATTGESDGRRTISGGCVSAGPLSIPPLGFAIGGLLLMLALALRLR
ncbi:MAG: hypothetical protein CSB49_02645 [Proteobacteria bacterium]|nr:MAG: hypothetical protein CSB49_02645 [Pseudomonadota bacterium]